jgi:hypothetical protein
MQILKARLQSHIVFFAFCLLAKTLIGKKEDAQMIARKCGGIMERKAVH